MSFQFTNCFVVIARSLGVLSALGDGVSSIARSQGFVQDWDVLCLEQLACCKSQKPILTTYAGSTRDFAFACKVLYIFNPSFPLTLPLAVPLFLSHSFLLFVELSFYLFTRFSSFLIGSRFLDLFRSISLSLSLSAAVFLSILICSGSKWCSPSSCCCPAARVGTLARRSFRQTHARSASEETRLPVCHHGGPSLKQGRAPDSRFQSP